MVYLECVSCKAQSIYNISQNSYVYLKGTCTNCQSSPRGRWSAVTLQNETLVLNISTTTTGSDSMHLVLRQGVLHHQDSYVFTLHVTDDSLDGEGAASITLHHNTPPDGGECSLRGEGDRDTDSEGFQVHTLRDRIYFNCSGRQYTQIRTRKKVFVLLISLYRGLSAVRSAHGFYLPSPCSGA
ncbi:polycystin-1-like [Thalassophryne amazonica]|uniref:polycystin-1-like n=1 Tax=Thalassophryne amazonica TaxID=390379 RepID=UPI001470E8F8|nr:polycystin-1-like [Thalassophryne amazonica]